MNFHRGRMAIWHCSVFAWAISVSKPIRRPCCQRRLDWKVQSTTSRT